VLRQLGNTRVHLLPAGCTDELQPIDAGIKRAVKHHINEVMFQWLEDPQHFQEWVTGMSVGRHRILLTQWVGDAWDHVTRGLDIEKIGR
jgi:hypothetical protein